MNEFSIFALPANIFYTKGKQSGKLVNVPFIYLN
jgi:hypothetical protein